MADTDASLDHHFTPPAPWAAELAALREIVVSAGLDEVRKWNSPVYCWQNRNVAILWGFKEAATLGFFKGSLLSDPDKRLVMHGPNSRESRSLRFHAVAEVEAARDLIRATLAEAIQIERDGRRVPPPEDDPDWPDELTERLAAEPALAEAFAALTPGRRRGYILHFGGAKKPETRIARIDKHAPRILAGKGMHDR